MNTTAERSNELETEALATVVSSFFERRVVGEEGKLLAQITRLLTEKVAAGSSHLAAEDLDGNFDEWKKSPAIGNEEANLPLVYTDTGKLYFRRFYEYEKSVTSALRQRCNRETVQISTDTEQFIKASLLPMVDEQQALAIDAVLRRDLVLLTGGPGTGKTRTIVAMLAAYCMEHPDKMIALAAPTGKAAFRMRESVMQALELIELPESIRMKILDSSKATTIHRLLGSRIGSVDFDRNEKNTLPYDLMVVDEASMIDLPLMAKLCQALREDTKLVLIGDADQLAPVQGGAVFNGLIQSFYRNELSEEDMGEVEIFSESSKRSQGNHLFSNSLVHLSKVHRRSGSLSTAKINELCEAIKDGRADDVVSILHSDADSISWMQDPEDPQLDSLLRDEFSELSNTSAPELALSMLGRFRILCANNEGRYGVSNWNVRADGQFSQSDKISKPLVIHSNDYALGLHNGDDGVILGQRAYFAGEDGYREIALSRLPQHKIGYASTIHRSQGSEFDKVVVILPPEDSKLLSRELLYVAVSRAKEKVFLVGSEDSLIAAVNRTEKQNSGIWDLMKHS
jgi:exodeoxyribonuclease V alpha subunit